MTFDIYMYMYHQKGVLFSVLMRFFFLSIIYLILRGMQWGTQDWGGGGGGVVVNIQWILPNFATCDIF